MRSADALSLLRAAHSAAALRPLVALLGFRAEPVALGRDAIADLRPACGLRSAFTIDGADTMRALVAEIDSERAPDVALPDLASRVAQRLTVLGGCARWTLALARRDGTGFTLAAAHADGRVAALVVDPRRVLASEAETFCALAAVGGTAEVRHARWLELLGRDALSRRFYRTLERTVASLATSASGVADREARHELALLYMSRLLFLAFLQSKGWLDDDHDYLRRGYDACMASGGSYHHRVLRPLFFGTLNTPWLRRASAARRAGRVPFLNGGLFARTSLERRHPRARLDDEALGTLVVALLGRYRFAPRETQRAYGESAIDPEMLGHAFESLMSVRDRRTTGAFYTPHAIVAHTTTAAIRHALGTLGRADALLDGSPVPAHARSALGTRLAELRVLDPACGSGAFLVHALERIATLRARCGDERPPAAIRRDVLTHAIFGVDANPTAVWLCELRLWLSVVVESDEIDPMQVAPLPNLDHHVRAGDSLASAPWARAWGGDPWGDAAAPPLRASTAGATLRARYVRASGRRKLALGAALDRAERTAAIDTLDRALATRRAERGALLAAARGRDLFGARRGSPLAERARLIELRALCRTLSARRRALTHGAPLPFGFAWHFPDLAARGGADVVLANPPWVRPHALAAADRVRLRATYETCRDASWMPGAIAAGSGRGFGGQVDLAAPFVERSLALTRPGGVAALVVPAKLWRSLAGGGVRRLLLREGHVRAVEDWSAAPSLFDAAVYPSIVVVERRHAGESLGTTRGESPRTTEIAIHDASSVRRWRTAQRDLSFDRSPGSPWLLVSPGARRAITSLVDAGTPLGTAGLGRITLGAKCGCNAAFVVRLVADDEADAVAHVDGVWPDGTARHGMIERAMLRPVVRGETLHTVDATNRSERIIWPCDDRGQPLASLPPLAARWLAPWRATLAARSDARDGRARWWSVFRTAGAASDVLRIVWADVARTLRPRLLLASDPTIALNSCYVFRCAAPQYAHALTALLASPVAEAWCAALAEPARGGYRRHLAWTVALFPVPRGLDFGGDGGSIEGLARAYGIETDEMRRLFL